jgi:hypothetical protein
MMPTTNQTRQSLCSFLELNSNWLGCSRLLVFEWFWWFLVIFALSEFVFHYYRDKGTRSERFFFSLRGIVYAGYSGLDTSDQIISPLKMPIVALTLYSAY